MHSHENQARIYEQEIELTVCNYEQLLEMERKNSAEKSEFLLYLIQSTYLKHTQEIEALKEQLEAAMAEKEEAKTLEQQMQTIGEGVDSIVQEGQRLKSQNETLLR